MLRELYVSRTLTKIQAIKLVVSFASNIGIHVYAAVALDRIAIASGD